MPSKTLLRPGEATHAANDAAGRAEIDVPAALAWRDFMVSDYSDAGRQRWLTDHGIDLIRGAGRLAGSGTVDVDGVRHTATDVVIATGSDPFVPPVPGLGDLDGVWTNREATGMREVPRRLAILGAGATGVQMAQAVRRLGGEVVLIDAAERVLAREASPLGAALGEVLARDGVELRLGVKATAEKVGPRWSSSVSAPTSRSRGRDRSWANLGPKRRQTAIRGVPCRPVAARKSPAIAGLFGSWLE